MGRLADVNDRIQDKLAEIGEDRDDLEQARRVVHRIEANVAETRTALQKAREVLNRRRDRAQALRAELAELEDDNPEEDTEEEAQIRARLDRTADLVDEAVVTRNRLLGKLDRLREREADAEAALEEEIAERDEDRKALTRLRARRERIKEQIAANDRPSPHFTWAEFDCNDGTPIPEGSKPAIRALCRNLLEPARARFGSIHINSGFRHAAYNRAIGGEPNSVHIYNYPGRSLAPPDDEGAVAADWTAVSGNATDWYNFAAGKADGRGRYSSFTHSDNRNRISWPDATWSG
jgi:predicted  nucleic acid-binding Zn-ribbon protein